MSEAPQPLETSPSPAPTWAPEDTSDDASSDKNTIEATAPDDAPDVSADNEGEAPKDESSEKSEAPGWRDRLKERYRQFRAKLDHFRLGRWEDYSSRELILLYPVRLTIQTFREMLQDKILVRASSMAFTTVMSLVPSIMVALVLMNAFGLTGEEVLESVKSYLMPVAGEEVSDFIGHTMNRASGSSFGAVGGLFLICIAVALFLEVEGVFNDVWKVRKRRPWLTRVLYFYAILTLGPILIALWLIEATNIDHRLSDLGFFGQLSNNIMTLVYSTLVFLAAYKWMPYTRVMWRYAASAALITAFLFQLAKYGFNVYVNEVARDNYDKLYGSLGLIPIFLLWIYLSWVIILFGASLSYVSQNLKRLMLVDKARRSHAPTNEGVFLGGSFVGLEVFSPIARGFAEHQGAITLDHIAAESGYHRSVVAEALEVLAERKLIIPMLKDDEQHAYLPGRPLDTIALIDLITPFEADEDDSPELETRVHGIIESLHARRASDLEDMTARDLVDVHHDT